MKEIIIVSICIVVFVICLGVFVWGVWTAISMICEAREKKVKRVKNYNAVVDCKLSIEY